MAGLLETLPVEDVAAAIYVGYFDRAPDPAGYGFWLSEYSRVTQGGQTAGEALTNIANSFAPQGETAQLYPFLVDDLNGDGTYEVRTVSDNSWDRANLTSLVQDIYTNLFGRTPAADDAGVQYWVNSLLGKVPNPEGGFFPAVPLGAAIIAIANGAQGDDATTLVNKIEVATYFVNEARAAGIGDTRAEVTDEFIAAARSVVEGVDETAASVEAAKDSVDTWIDGGAANPGQTFVLTVDTDVLTGTNANDTFIATGKATALGGLQNTLQNSDILDGGAGVDTLKFTDVGGSFVGDGFSETVVPTLSNIENIEARFTAWGGLDLASSTGVQKISVSNSTTWGHLYNVGAVANFAVSNDKVGNDVEIYGGTATDVNLSVSNYGSVDQDVQGDIYFENNALKSANLNVSNSDVMVHFHGDTTNLKTVAIQATGTNVVDVSEASGNIETLTVTGAGSVDFDGTIFSAVKTLNAGAATGDLTNIAVDDTATSVTLGAGNDELDYFGDVGKTTVINTGAGDDFLDVSGTVVKGASINLGAGNDAFDAGSVDAGAIIDGGAGTDTLALRLVGAANVGSFSNFEVFDVAGMSGAFDVNILATKNTVNEIVGSDDLAADSTLSNLGAGVNFRATGDMGTTNTLTLTQATAGALTITLDADEAEANELDGFASTAVKASNSTSLKAVFDVDFADKQGGDLGIDNFAVISLAGDAATTLEVVSGGTESANILSYVGGAKDGKGLLTSITITGDQALDVTDIDFGGAASQVATIDASALTGDLLVETGDLKDGGTIKLGSGTDLVVVDSTGTSVASIEKIVGFELSTSLTDAAALDVADALDFSGAEVVAANGSGAGYTISNGVLSFTGTGPTTFEDALTLVDGAVNTANAVVAFEYTGNTYVFSEGGLLDATDNEIVQLAGTDVSGLTVSNGLVFLA